MYAWNMGNSSGKWSSFRTPWTGAIIILWAPVPSCKDALRSHCVPFLHSYFWGIIRWWTILHDHHQAKSLQQQSLFDHNDTYGTQTIARMICVNIQKTCSLIYIYIYYPLYNNWPITNADLPHVIIQYILYFICQKLYWTISGEMSNIR